MLGSLAESGPPGIGGQTPLALSQVSGTGDSLSLTVPYFGLGTLSNATVVVDSFNNIWTQGNNGLTKFDSDGNQKFANTGLNASDEVGYEPFQSLTFDSNGASLYGSDVIYGLVNQINAADGSNVIDYYYNTFVAQYTPLVAGPANADLTPGNVYGCSDPGGQVLDVFNPSSISILDTYNVTTTRGCGNQMVMDGAGHIFTITGGTAPGIIDEFSVSSSGITPISPSYGYTGWSTGETPTINPDPHVPVTIGGGSFAPIAGVAGAAIDGSGNLWVLNANTGTTSSPGNALVEYIGIAAPIVTPTAQALNFGQVGVRP